MVAGFLGILAIALLRKGNAQELRADWPANFGHRGDSANAPENTLESFRKAVDSGAEGLELDAHMTRDGKIVVIHDDTLGRTTDGEGYVRDKTLAEIKQLDAGYSFADGGAHPYRGKGLRILTLDEVFREFPDVAINVEIKEDVPGIEEAILAVIQSNGAKERTLVAAGDHGIIKRFREVSGGAVSTSASEREIRNFFLVSRLNLESFFQPPYEALQIPVVYGGANVATPKFIEAAHNRGVRVDVWTVNEPDEMNRLLNLGVDVIMTNHPKVLSKVLEQRREQKT